MLPKLRKGVSVLLGMGTAVGVGLTSLAPASAVPWGQLLFNGIQLLQLSNVSPKQTVTLGQNIHQQVKQNYRLNSNSQTNAYVNRVGQRLARASNCSEIPFHFYVVQDSSINAFSTTGGYVYVNTGLLKATDNEDQLAAVMGHEIGHICNNDLINKLKQSQLAQGAASLAGLDQSAVTAIAYKLAVDLPNSREAEYNADDKGLQYMKRAGYNPKAMPAFLKKLLNQSSQPSFLSDHPGTKERISVIERKIAAGR
ncbi:MULTISPECIES: M48 family metallopeptidase [unclassified Tolypothrix]|uniref:M48 family metallopeptidase n=1 Tax=unclassified Tolypothrix TaxID=2649714 RepID=UPI0005EABE01|nr:MULTISPECIES: M48 family metallopeptidase [unclassified Tolypothrix]BAY89599.1 peptidase M48 [Microchaete diplosiphon NIES-3275]EKF02579.1 M48 family peptidase [Tolypothrix sp. PCC 7601]MBE9085405.1 M48 family metalloprotease [Tolypothrix sp. LEGE 11397]UYD23872.1 M48 family metalloprotease [Tolypothrix sp. PCC 7712]UYD33903.1 M48 family metalloprotease [Tolypothrix sp. PCC 7601]